MGGSAGRGIAQGKPLISAGSLARLWGAGVMLGAAEAPLVVQGPDQGHGQTADLLDRKGGIS